MAADGALGWTEGDVLQVVQSVEESGIRELTHPGQETEPDVRVAWMWINAVRTGEQ